jgi:hypothetical protein
MSVPVHQQYICYQPYRQSQSNLFTRTGLSDEDVLPLLSDEKHKGRGLPFGPQDFPLLKIVLYI